MHTCSHRHSYKSYKHSPSRALHIPSHNINGTLTLHNPHPGIITIIIKTRKSDMHMHSGEGALLEFRSSRSCSHTQYWLPLLVAAYEAGASQHAR